LETSVRNTSMCGIFGHYTFQVPHPRREILDTLFAGLHRLEYRGYDSAGMAIDSDDPVKAEVEASPLGRKGLAGIDVNIDAATDLGPLCERAAKFGTQQQLLGKHRRDFVPRPVLFKASGKVDELVASTREQAEHAGLDLDRVLTAHSGIAHTRWATHGAPSPTNAHPHASGPLCEFVVVHNGIIANYRTLREFLKSHGDTFVSETDTEVVPKLCSYVYKKLNRNAASKEGASRASFCDVVAEVMAKLEGAFALLIKSTHYPCELIACKRGSPLIMGIKASPVHFSPMKHTVSSSDSASMRAMEDDALECFIASDASSFVEHTKKVVVLEDDDVLHLSRGAYGIYSASDGQRGDVFSDGVSLVRRQLSTLDIEVASIMKGGYDHYMAKEIHEQPDSILQTMRGRVSFASKGASGIDPYMEHRIKLGGLADHLPAMRRARRFLFVGCGTSFHACLACRQTIEELVDVPVSLELASDMIDRQSPVARDDVCVFVSQSGETADTLAALRFAKDAGALCVGITNTVGSAIARLTDCGVHINAGCEIGVASTKAYTSQIVAITMLALALSHDSISRRVARDAIIDGLAALPGAVKQALCLDKQMLALAERLQHEHSLLVFGRGYNYATALEAALKVKEVSLMHSEGILAGEMKHGPLALVDEEMPIVVVATRDRMHGKMMSVIEQLRARGARLIVVCNEDDEAVSKSFSGSSLGTSLSGRDAVTLVRVPHIKDALQPVVNIVPLQLLSYHLTVLRGHNVDQPRNLAKSVTVTED
jgi:glutamine---fructose-6-phosphate transaminase (isomerizing)